MGPQVTAAILIFILLQKSSSPLQFNECKSFKLFLYYVAKEDS